MVLAKKLSGSVAALSLGWVLMTLVQLGAGETHADGCASLDALLTDSHPGVWPPEYAFDRLFLKPHQLEAASKSNSLTEVQLHGFCPSDQPGTWLSGNFTYHMPLSDFGGDFVAAIAEVLRHNTYLEVRTEATSQDKPMTCPLSAVALETFGPPALRFQFDERHPACGRYVRLAAPLRPSEAPGEGMKLMKWVCQVASVARSEEHIPTMCEVANNSSDVQHIGGVSYAHTIGATPVDLDLSLLLQALSESGVTRTTVWPLAEASCSPGRGGGVRYSEFLPLDFFTLNGFLAIDSDEWEFMQSFREMTAPEDANWHYIDAPVRMAVDAVCVADCDGGLGSMCRPAHNDNWDPSSSWDHVMQYPRLGECLADPKCRVGLATLWGICILMGMCAGGLLIVYFHEEPVRKVKRVEIVYQTVNATPMQSLRSRLFGPSHEYMGGILAKDEMRSAIIH